MRTVIWHGARENDFTETIVKIHTNIQAVYAVGLILAKDEEYQQASAKGVEHLEMKRRTSGWLRRIGRCEGLRGQTLGRIMRHQLGLRKGRWNGHAFQFLSLTRGRLPALLDSTSWYHRACMRGRLVWLCTANRDASLSQRRQWHKIAWTQERLRRERRVRKYSECRIVA